MARSSAILRKRGATAVVAGVVIALGGGASGTAVSGADVGASGSNASVPTTSVPSDTGATTPNDAQLEVGAQLQANQRGQAILARVLAGEPVDMGSAARPFVGIGMGTIQGGAGAAPADSTTATAAQAPSFACTAFMSHEEHRVSGPKHFAVGYRGFGLCTLPLRQRGQAHLHRATAAEILDPFIPPSESDPLINLGSRYDGFQGIAESVGNYTTRTIFTVYGHHRATMFAPPGGRFTEEGGGCAPAAGGRQLRCSVYTEMFTTAS